MNVTPKPGDLVKFDFIYGGCDLNNKLAAYIGPEFIHRDDGVTVENHRILVVGRAATGLIDRNLFCRLTIAVKA